MLIGSIAALLGGRKSYPVSPTELAGPVCVGLSPSCGMHPRFGLRFNPVMVEIRQAESSYTAQKS